ncbi:hypothetical protein [Streptomyces showdoensis]|uniref:hypothetical protein n=1 Tax=Streptomyces showdoensis TaxID=68268 RepID=UPI00103C9655|nr:hypothetical protein [Streptomyces showdoensis]
MTRGWCPAPGPRTRRFRLTEIVHAAAHTPDHDHESPLGYRFVVETTRRTRPYRVWCRRPFAIQETSRTRHSPRLVHVIARAIRQAQTERQRAVPAVTYGLGPWPEETRREIGHRAPGPEEPAPRGDHRAAVEETLADWRGEPRPHPLGRPASRTPPSTEPPWPTSHRPGFTGPTPCRALVDGLDAQAGIEATPQRQTYLAELMHGARTPLREAHEDRTPLRRRLLNGW